MISQSHDAEKVVNPSMWYRNKNNCKYCKYAELSENKINLNKTSNAKQATEGCRQLDCLRCFGRESAFRITLRSLTRINALTFSNLKIVYHPSSKRGMPENSYFERGGRLNPTNDEAPRGRDPANNGSRRPM